MNIYRNANLLQNSLPNIRQPYFNDFFIGLSNSKTYFLTSCQIIFSYLF